MNIAVLTSLVDQLNTVKDVMLKRAIWRRIVTAFTQDDVNKQCILVTYDAENESPYFWLMCFKYLSVSDMERLFREGYLVWRVTQGSFRPLTHKELRSLFNEVGLC